MLDVGEMWVGIFSQRLPQSGLYIPLIHHMTHHAISSASDNSHARSIRWPKDIFDWKISPRSVMFWCASVRRSGSWAHGNIKPKTTLARIQNAESENLKGATSES